MSFLLRTPLAEILAWPAWHADAYRAFLEREPPPEQRIELILARIGARVFNATRGQGQPAFESTEFLLPRDLWGSINPEPAGEAPGGGISPEEMLMIGHLDGRPSQE